MAKKQASDNTICRNRQARFRYELIENIEAGVVLSGTEVKSLRAGGGSLDESFARLRDGEVFLFGFHIPPYANAGPYNHDPTRPRKLLLKRREIDKIEPKLTQKGLTLVPVSAYFNERGLVKIRLALARGKTFGDKRQNLKRKTHQRDMAQAMRRRR